MDLDFTSEQDMLRDAASKFFPNECPYARVKELEESEEGYTGSKVKNWFFNFFTE